ncbi:MAG: PQQ-binding-like beta-propeller repeat protein [Planctomycetota bacterium]
MVGCSTAKKTETRGLVPPGAEFRTGLPFEPGYAHQFGYTHRWARSLELSSKQSVHAIRTLGDLVVTVERPRNLVTALNANDGSLAWKRSLGEPLETFYAPFGNDEFIFVNSARRLFKLYRRTGETVQIYDLPRPVTMSPLLVEDIAVFGSVNGNVYGFDVVDGYRKWSYGLNGRIMSTPLSDGESVFVADSSGTYAMLMAKTGDLRWRGATYGQLTSEPVRHALDIVIASDDQSLYSLRANTGERRWPVYRSEVPLSQTPAAFGDVIYVVEPGLGLTALDSRTGKPIWKAEESMQPVAEVNGKVVAYADKTLSKIDPETGDVIQTVPTREIEIFQPGPGQSLLMVTPKGEIMRIDPRP